MTYAVAASPGPWARLPADRPFTTTGARSAGVSERQLSRWVAEGSVVTMVRGVHRLRSLPDSLGSRVSALRLVVPVDGVVVDRTAAWLHGATHALAPGDHLEVPPVSVFRRPGYRLRNPITESGERTLSARDVTDVGGVPVTTVLRTAVDLGRLLPRDQAFAALNALARVGGLTPAAIGLEATRFAGARGVRQLRALAPLVEPRVASPGESSALLCCLDAGLEGAVPQLRVDGPGGSSYYLDLAFPALGLAVEYDGAEFHGDDRSEHDERRRRWIRDVLGWTLLVLTRDDVYGPHARAEQLIRAAAAQAVLRRPVVN